MRLAGATLEATRRATGLSIPTVIAAHKAYQAGGWDAVVTQKGGRPAAGYEKLTPEAIQALQTAMLANDPSQLQEPGEHRLWSQNAMVAWFKHQCGLAVPVRNAARLVHSWGLNCPNLLAQAKASRSLDVVQWMAAHYPALQADARKAGGQILWAGQRQVAALHCHQIYAHTPRGQVFWLLFPKTPGLQDWRAFLEGLIAQFPHSQHIVLDNPYLLRPQALGKWLTDQGERMCAVCLPTGQPALADLPAPQATPAATSSFSTSTTRQTMPLTHLQRLEAESIHIMREVVAEAENPVMLYSIGKDSAVMLHLALKAFYPAIPPFPLLHVDTRWKFRDMYAFRDKVAKETGMELLVHINPDGVAKNINPFTHGSAIHTDIMKTEGLKQALDKHRFDAAFGGARRDEEKSRAKERIFSFRTAQHRWDPKNQRPELWKLYNARKHKGESMRVFPLSNWTELDIWQYIYLENIPIVPLYYSASRPVVERDGALIMVDDDRMPLKPGEVPMMKKVRFRTLGCYPLTGAVESEADTLPAIIQEMLLTRTSERQGRVIDHDSAASMEKKKQEGYF
ncbi:sulfate adenylyltransferase subunit CysD [Allopusillimonas soli]|uniref:Sulfate adenylyltransferase subunit 2 n=1 Tax=Allopusillimonas soli TaxID=659016 RepID=A0A853F8N0_9BURK|nr:sulfate adenylyltransferase subunit CysD [Allopusillimonas soli]NYT36453.1 sulfate adenylyltransferase subunit CysD [Allopusillimonas soli]TEA75591.1 sulfate adenylyltransferase subunit CysD [Allopusillimonas soli]